MERTIPVCAAGFVSCLPAAIPVVECGVDSTADRVLAQLRVPSARWRQPVLVELYGLPGAGKTHTARRLARRHPLALLSTDAVRLRHGLPSGPAAHAAILAAAAPLLRASVSVLFDGIHLGRRDRDQIRSFAARHGSVPIVVHATAHAAAIAARLQERQRDPTATAAAGKFVITREQFERIAAFLEPVAADEEVWVIDTSQGAPGEQLRRLHSYLDRLRSAEAATGPTVT